MNARHRLVVVSVTAVLATLLSGGGAWAQPERLQRRVVPLVRRVVEVKPRVVNFEPREVAREPDSTATEEDEPAPSTPPQEGGPPAPGDGAGGGSGEERAPSGSSPPRRVTVPSDVLFDVDEDQLAPSAKRFLERLARELGREGVRRIVVTGHTDSSGSGPYNLALSRRRAASVRDHLASRAALDGVTIQAVGVGEGEPVANDQAGDPAAARRNRRVTITYTPR